MKVVLAHKCKEGNIYFSFFTLIESILFQIPCKKEKKKKSIDVRRAKRMNEKTLTPDTGIDLGILQQENYKITIKLNTF